MNKAITLGHLALLAAACAFSPEGVAAPCGGTNINNTLTFTPTEIVKGVQVSIYRFTSVILSEDPSASFHLASGECVGSLLTGLDGKQISLSGSCARKDKDGDVIYEEWVGTAPGKGTAKVIGGTGKFANASWSYNWQRTPLHGPTAAVRWSGDCR